MERKPAIAVFDDGPELKKLRGWYGGLLSETRPQEPERRDASAELADYAARAKRARELDPSVLVD